MLTNTIRDEPPKDKVFNVCFYIHSQTGRAINDFLAPKTKSLKAFYKTILFESGSEFMVCKVEEERVK